ncbi:MULTISPECIES: phosphoribosylanthranilate isomerase [unclassified Achromobacter]|uniref:phosphoribosylanthranilate isomerase n=1 Tax=unclassified Achromobacter TaxID=2626865 RepID=UPI000B519623|nr:MULTISPECIES: phosphoribosylanthranilate isomerase [unclassified Achromobacter]OWT77172.1 N-(5'-phosphoribosyl)anthranilate isomerase [Achromobacter sp. HZ28]OWT78053.1 N-(5'-phosphoribosyl)anthranilate isomerase [Achromobacter sp. HZ34]
MRTRIKFCGMTRNEDIAAAVAAGADAIGMIFYPKSKRCIDVAQAARLRRAVPAFVDVVALVVNATEEEVRRIIGEVGPDLLQFHGDETPADCRVYGHRYLRALRVGGPGMDTAAALAATCATYGDAAGWLFDSYTSGFGGSGLAFDHHLLDDVRKASVAAACSALGEQHAHAAVPLILSGGLTPENVEAAVRTVRPYAVDVSSGVERSPGIKVHDKMRAFVDAVRRADEA